MRPPLKKIFNFLFYIVKNIWKKKIIYEVLNPKSTAVNACLLVGACPSNLVKNVAFCCFWVLLVFYVIHLCCCPFPSIIIMNESWLVGSSTEGLGVFLFRGSSFSSSSANFSFVFLCSITSIKSYQYICSLWAHSVTSVSYIPFSNTTTSSSLLALYSFPLPLSNFKLLSSFQVCLRLLLPSRFP